MIALSLKENHWIWKLNSTLEPMRKRLCLYCLLTHTRSCGQQCCGTRGAVIGGSVPCSRVSFNTTTEVRPLSKAPNPRLLPGCRSIAAHCSRYVCSRCFYIYYYILLYIFLYTSCTYLHLQWALVSVVGPSTYRPFLCRRHDYITVLAGGKSNDNWRQPIQTSTDSAT